jgi:hypothetical protein
VAKTLTEIRSLARSHTRTALNVLVGIMRSKDATPAARVSAANAILDRGWGKAPQAIENGGDGTLELVHRIERVIVHPETAEIGHWYEPDKLIAYCVAVYFAKLLVWDKVLGLGTTDPLAGFAAVTSNLVVSFYFAKRGFENVARIIKR